MPGKDKRYLTNSVLRATQILESFSREKTSFSNVELQRRLGVNKSSLRRILYTLEYAGFLEKDLKTGRYSLAVKLFRIGSVYLSKLDLYSLAKPYLVELAELHRETSNLGVLHGNEVIIIDRGEGNSSVRMESLVGTRLPASCTAIGKVLLAHIGEERIEEILSTSKLKPFTSNTITKKSELKKNLEQIRRQGYSMEDREFNKNITSIAAPVFDNRGKVIAGLSVAGLFISMEPKKIREGIIKSVKEIAGTISGKLGYDSSFMEVL